MPDSQVLFVIIIALLVLNFALSGLVAMRVSQWRADSLDAQKRQPNSKPSNSELIVAMAEKVNGIDRELLPKDGASLSFRVNELTRLAHEAVTGTIAATANSRSTLEEARHTAQRAAEERSRLEREFTELQSTVDGYLVATARTTEAAVKIIQNTVTGTQNAVEVASSKIDQIAAGSGVAQTKTVEAASHPLGMEQTKTDVPVETIKPIHSAVATAEEGVSKTQEGVEQIQEGIGKLKGEIK